MSLFEIKCPMCKGKLWIDLTSGKVVDHRSADHEKADFEQFLKSSKQNKAWDAKMKKAMEEEARRKAEIEQKFKQAKDNIDNDTSSPDLKSPFDWD